MDKVDNIDYMPIEKCYQIELDFCIISCMRSHIQATYLLNVGFSVLHILTESCPTLCCRYLFNNYHQFHILSQNNSGDSPCCSRGFWWTPETCKKWCCQTRVKTHILHAGRFIRSTFLLIKLSNWKWLHSAELINFLKLLSNVGSLTKSWLYWPGGFTSLIKVGDMNLIISLNYRTLIKVSKYLEMVQISLILWSAILWSVKTGLMFQALVSRWNQLGTASAYAIISVP